MDDAERTRRTAEVLRLLDSSFAAHARGDTAACDLAMIAACRLDCECVSVIQGGVLIGNIPNPEHDPAGWAEYVQAAQDAADQYPANPPTPRHHCQPKPGTGS